MRQNWSYIRGIFWCCIMILIMQHTAVRAQQSPQQPAGAPRQSQILILENDYVEYINQDTLSIQRLVKNVKLLHDSDTIYCDSAVVIRQLNTAEAFGDVLVRQADGTEALADYMRYTGNNKTVFMRGNVQLNDGKGNELWGSEVTYNLRTKLGQYSKDGTLISGQTMVSSNQATYNMKNRDARFKGNVIVNDPEYYVVSRDLGYNTDTKIVTFFAPSVVTNDNSMLQTRSGYYTTGDKTSRFWSRSSILNDGQYIEADTIFYTKSTGWAQAYGNVIMIDTSRHNSTMYSGYAEYNELTKKMLAYLEPVVKYITGDKTYYYRADTFFSEPVPYEENIMTAQDSIQRSVEEIRQSIDRKVEEGGEIHKDEDYSVEELLGLEIRDTSVLVPIRLTDTVRHILPEVVVLRGADDLDGRHRNRRNVKSAQEALTTSRSDSSTAGGVTPQFIMNDSLPASGQTYYNYPASANDSNAKRYFLGYHQVRIYSDSLQGKCDSMKYNQEDSLITLYKNPVIWSGNNQMKGDIILLLLDSSDMREIAIPKNGIVIARSGPPQAGFFDQIQGNYIKGYLSDGKIDSLIAERDAMNIYYMKDDDDFYSGVNESKSDRIEAVFEKEAIKTISYRGPTDGETTPMTEISPDALKLPRFIWYSDEERIQSLEQFLKDRKLQEPQLFRWGKQL